ncbi:phage tail tube protein [Pedobacter sp. MC2016-24]|uniref:phage tail tube protein n=1 Tax=Pedobacter sp. MC2016-24 TaxID=2780090 RepID=UPI0018828EA4|nr:phage tail tube protein [Pedobacter sp. MC2016-24]MBE9598741.1 hypothetical protein [Pedobacter sp. MC2016-24]
MQRNILSGSEFLLYNIDNEPVAYSKNCAIKINQNLTNVTTKDSDSWTELMVGLKDWSIEFEGLVSYGDGFNTNYFIEKYKTNEPFFIRLGVVQDDFTHAFFGEVYIEGIDQTANDGEVSSYSGSLKGVGNLSFTDEGTPVQSGYIKTETDPVFRGSPAFNISNQNIYDWKEAHNKVVKEIGFTTTGITTTLKVKFNDGNVYSTSFQAPIPIVDLSGYYTKGQTDVKIAETQVAADNALALLSNISNDSKLTPNEKVNVLKELQIIQDEYPKLVQQAIQYDVSTLNYDVSFIQLGVFVEPLLVSMLTTENLDGFELRNIFRAYYDQKLSLEKAITKASVDNIKIGSRNFHLKGDKNVLVYHIENQVLQNGNYPTNSELAISFYARSIDGTSKLYLEFDGKDGAEFDVPANWRRFSCVIKSGDLPILYARIGQFLSVLNLNLFDLSKYPTFPYLFPMNWDATNESNGIELKNIMVVLGNKATDFVPAPEDYYDLINKAKTDAQNAAAIYADAQRILAETNAAAYADGIIDDIEATLIGNAQNNLAAAKAYSDAQDLIYKTIAAAYADGKITIEEQKRIDAVQVSLDAAKAYTLAQSELSEVIIKSYADGIVSDEEARAIADAQAKLNTAKAYADQKALELKGELVDYVDQSIVDKANEIIANTTTQINVANTATLQAAKDDAQTKVDIAKAAAVASAKTYTDAERILAETTAAAYSDGKITQEEQARITQAQNNLQAAKDDATNKANAAAAYGIAAQNLHNALIGNLKGLAYEDVVEVSKLGSTVVQGGVIKTSLLDVNYIKAGIVNADYIKSLGIISSSIKTAETGQRVEILSDNNIKFYTSGSTVPMITIDDKLVTEDSSTYPTTMGAGISIGDFDNQSLGYTQLGRKRSSFTGDLSVNGITNLFRFSHIGAKNSNYKLLSNNEDYTITADNYVIIAADNCQITWPLGQNYDGREMKISTCYTTTNTTLFSQKYIHGVDALDGATLTLLPNKVYNYLVCSNVIVAI